MGCPTTRALSTHLQKVHKIPFTRSHKEVEKAKSLAMNLRNSSSDSKDCSALYTSAPILRANNSQEVPPLDPLAELPVRDGVQCSACFTHYSTPRTLPSHLEKVHSYSQENARMETNRLSSRHMVRVQTLFGGNKTKFFPVTNTQPKGDLVVTGSISEVTARLVSPKVKAEPKASLETTGLPVMGGGTEHRVEHAPGADEGIMSGGCTERGTVASVQALFQTLGSHDEEACIEEALKNSFTCATHFDDALHLLGLSPDDALEIMKPSLQLEDNTVLKCEDVVKVLLQYFGKLGHMLPNTSSRVLQALNMRNESRQFQRTSKETEKRYAVHVAHLLLFAQKSAFMEFDSSNDLSPVLDLFQNWNREEEGHQERLHRALRCLLHATIEVTDSMSLLVVRNFMVCACIIPESSAHQDVESVPYRHASAKEASPILAALQYSVGAVGVHETFHIRETFRGEDKKSLRARKTERLFASVSIEGNSAAVFIRNTLNTAMGILKKEESPPNFDLCNTHEKCGVLKYSHLSMGTLGKLVSSQHETFDGIFYNTLLLGASIPATFNSGVPSLRDLPHNKSPGFSFMKMESQLKLAKESTAFVLGALQKPSPENLHKTPCILSDEANPSDSVVRVVGVPMRKSRVEKFLKTCWELQKCLILCMHFSSGAPARSTEIRALRLHNDAHSVRNLFILQDGQVVINPTYSKARAMSGHSGVIYRFPDKETSLRLLQYYFFIRPLECAMIGSLRGKDAMSKQWTFMFAKNGCQFPDVEIRKHVAAALHSVGAKFGYADYRQFSCGMVPVVCTNKLQDFAREILDEFISSGHEQASHTRDTAERKYARSSGDLLSVSTSKLAKTKQFSFQWHSLLGLQSTIRDEVMEALLSKDDDCPQGAKPMKEKVNPSPSGRLSANGKVQSTVVFSAALPAPVPSSTPPSIFSEALFQRSPAAVHLHVGRLDQHNHMVQSLTANLKAATGSRTAEFKSQTQFSVTAFVFSCHFNALVLMPTGAGKTMCVFLPAVMEKVEKKSTIIIVPLKALVGQHLSTAATLGLVASSGFGDPGADVFADLYVFSAEQVHKPAFAELICRLLTRQHLSRVVIDEAHLTLLWASFRMSLKCIRTGLSVIPSHIPRIFLSATVPPHQRANVLEIHGLNDATVFAMPTIRKNLGFEVTVFQNQSRKVDAGGRYVAGMSRLLLQSLDLLVKCLVDEEKSRDDSSKTVVYRVMVYVLTRREVRTVKEELEKRCDALLKPKDIVTQILMYHGAMLDEERQQMHEAWCASPCGVERGGVRIMVCTSAFGTGVDVPNVRITLHIGGARSLVEFVQECGRAGRDGLKAICLTTYDVRCESSITHDQDGTKSETEKLVSIQRRNEMTTWILSDTTCRKNRLYSYIDGGAAGVCRFDTKTVWCDVCTVGVESLDSDDIFVSTPESDSLWYDSGCVANADCEPPASPPASREQIRSINESHFRGSFRKRSSTASAAELTGSSRKRPSSATPAGPPPTRRRSGYKSLTTIPRFDDTTLAAPGHPGSASVKTPASFKAFFPRSAKMGHASAKGSASRRPGIYKINDASAKGKGSASGSTKRPGTIKIHSPKDRRQLLVQGEALEPHPWIDTAPLKKVLELLHDLINLTTDKCLTCLAAKQVNTLHSSRCPWLGKHCLRCFSNTHIVKACPEVKNDIGKCFGCRMRDCKDGFLHGPGGFTIGL